MDLNLWTGLSLIGVENLVEVSPANGWIAAPMS